MAKGHAVGPEIENLIGKVHDEHPKWKAPKVWEEVENRLRERAIKTGKAVENRPGEFLSLSKVQHVLTDLRNPGPLDKPWSISAGIAASVEISADTLPFVLETWIFMKDVWNHDLTIREARWLDRLHSVYHAALTNLGPEASGEDRVRVTLQFLHFAGIYAAGERMGELTGRGNPGGALDFAVWMALTGQSGSPELMEKLFPDKREILVQTEDGWIAKCTKKDLRWIHRVNRLLKIPQANHVVSFELDESLPEETKRGTK
jgi:hypothetical protein